MVDLAQRSDSRAIFAKIPSGRRLRQKGPPPNRGSYVLPSCTASTQCEFWPANSNRFAGQSGARARGSSCPARPVSARTRPKSGAREAPANEPVAHFGSCRVRGLPPRDIERPPLVTGPSRTTPCGELCPATRCRVRPTRGECAPRTYRRESRRRALRGSSWSAGRPGRTCRRAGGGRGGTRATCRPLGSAGRNVAPHQKGPPVLSPVLRPDGDRTARPWWGASKTVVAHGPLSGDALAL